MEDRIKEFLESVTTLRPINVDEGEGKDIFPSITFHFYNETGIVFGAGKAAVETASCQIDFWYRKKTEEIKQAMQDIKQAIINESTFSCPVKEGNYEADKKIYHTHYTFELIKKGGE